MNIAPCAADKCYEIVGLSTFTCTMLIILFAIFFSGVAYVAWRVWEKRWLRFQGYTLAAQADNVSRLNSTIHACIVSPILLYAMLAADWNEYYHPVSSPSLMQGILTVSLGYFICDFYIMYQFKPPLWHVFMIHHIMASAPYVTYYFTNCHFGLYIMGTFMLVEFTNATQNIKSWLEDFGMTKSKLYTFLIYELLFCWVVFRLIIPPWAYYVMYAYIIPSLEGMNLYCAIPGVVCGIFVIVFSYIAFFTITVKEIYARWANDGTHSTDVAVV